MSYDARIILGGRSPDIVNALAVSEQGRQQRLDNQNQNAMRDMLKTQGAGIMAGDQNALAQLAQYDPSAALGIQTQRQDMAYNDKRLSVLGEQEKRAAAEYAAGLSAEQRAAEAAQLEGTIKQALAAPTPQAFDAMMIEMGRQDMVGQFDNRQALAAPFMEIADILKMNTPEKINPNDRFKVAGGTIFDLGAEGGPKPVGQGAMQETTVFGPDGKPVMVQGGPGTAAKFTEGQSKDNVYATRAEGALARLEPVADALSGLGDRMLGMDPTGIARGAFQSDEFQTAQQAGGEFLQAILRKDTGAAITADEQALYGQTYLPQLGDNAAVLEQKRVARAGALEAIRSGMNAQQLEAVARADAATIARLSAQPGGAPGAAPPPGGTKRLKFNPETGEIE